jgi:hypothetical protein
LVQDIKHRSLLGLLRKIIDVPLGYSKEDLVNFRSVSSREFPAFVPILDEYLRFAERADTEVIQESARPKSLAKHRNDSESMHLFDMLRDRKLFPMNSDLADFAGRVLPDMGSYRYDKMSRGDIASRIIEYLETRDRKTRHGLESSMREAMGSSTDKPAVRKSFFAKWEKIIKGIEL